MTTYRLKRIRFKHNSECHILLQNENGPCPLLAAANGLLLRGTLALPTHCRAHGVASLQDVTNMLADLALAGTGTGRNDDAVLPAPDGDDPQAKLFVEELLRWIPEFQHGMDLNLGFRRVDQYEYTPQLTAWDLFRLPLLHGWLVDPEAPEAAVVGNSTYNVLVERVVQAREAAAELERFEQEVPLDVATSTDVPALQARHDRIGQLQHLATEGALVEHFLEATSHQLTEHGLRELRRHMANEQLAVFFRNNHFALMTKHDDQLYLLVTDLGYADSENIVWERLDAIDGNTTLVDADFGVAPHHKEEEEAFQLALQLSLQQRQTPDRHLTTEVMPPPPAPAPSEPVVAMGVPLGTPPVAEPASIAPLTSSASPPKETLQVHGSVMAVCPDHPHAVTGPVPSPAPPTDPDALLAIQLQNDWSAEDAASLQLARQLEAEDAASLHLARQLQAEEDARTQRTGGTTAASASNPARARSQSQAGCILS